MATTVAPSAAANRANVEPTLPKPCTAIRRPASGRSSFRSAATRQNSAPLAVASSRPSEPPIASGLPVTTPSTE